KKSGPGVYLSWDQREDRKEIQRPRWPAGEALIVLDELHKYRFWKRWIKGEFDKHKDHLRFLVTGSARLDVYRRGGDSLQGRYHHYRLHPFSLAEVERRPRAQLPVPGEAIEVPPEAPEETLRSILRFGGFPEPFIAQSERTLRRWQKERLDRFFREDVRDLEAVQDLSSMELLADLLVERVASPLSLNALREDLEVSHRTVTRWMGILERLYYVFRLRPYTVQTVRGLRKMPKAYLWDHSMVPQPGPRFENLVASHIFKLCNLLEDSEGYRVELRYLRDAMGHEVDFLVLRDRAPWFAVEAKVSGDEIDPSLRYYRDKLKIPWAYQVVLEGQRDFVEDGIRCLPAARFLAALA
ncbi:MAG: ATP-binding protein, partial [Planctomycetes bacterium]|nr:ATP-binding protein [Planctomycetota bacterium]